VAGVPGVLGGLLEPDESVVETVDGGTAGAELGIAVTGAAGGVVVVVVVVVVGVLGVG
jgi:hypothetical protein